jgi:hypothetical protein
MVDGGLLSAVVTAGAVMFACIICCKWCMIRRDYELHSISLESIPQATAPLMEYEPLPSITEEEDEPSVSV